MIQTVKTHVNNTIQENKKKRLAKFYKNSKNKPNNVDCPKPPVTQVYGETSPMPIKPKIIIPDVNMNVVKKTESRIIPLNLFQTWHTLDLPPKMKENVELLKRQNPEFTHYLYDDKMCRDFIRDHFHEDILWAFDKLNPGSYKADLWRYCVLYIHGGIYLDIKYKCVNNFKLIQLTNKEYWIKDRLYPFNSKDAKYGIYQGLLICLPKNNILFDCINCVLNNCKYSLYNNNDLSVTGPHLFTTFFKNIHSLIHSFTGNFITNKSTNILEKYKQYYNEQSKHQITTYYAESWYKRNIYNYPILQNIHSHNLSKIINTKYFNYDYNFYSGTPCIIPHPFYNKQYIVNIRWINYSFYNNESKYATKDFFIKPSHFISINSMSTYDYLFNKINDKFIQNNIDNEINYLYKGIEDIRIFYDGNTIYYIGSVYNPNNKLIQISSNKYNINNDFILSKNIIKVIDKPITNEKNWSMFMYNNKMHIVYKWFPLEIGIIDYNNFSMKIIETKNDLPIFFKDTKGTTNGVIYNNEIWFVLHKSQSYKDFHNYQHFFAIFDLNMNVKRHSELFKFSKFKIEFCTGLIIENDRIILSYSIMDTSTYVSYYNHEYINNGIKWYKY